MYTNEYEQHGVIECNHFFIIMSWNILNVEKP